MPMALVAQELLKAVCSVSYSIPSLLMTAEPDTVPKPSLNSPTIPIVGQGMGNDEPEFRREIENLIEWC